jgi:hypothetical protein
MAMQQRHKKLPQHVPLTMAVTGNLVPCSGRRGKTEEKNLEIALNKEDARKKRIHMNVNVHGHW